ncbi:MAG TPA: EF-hand domain-containing protein, partial [Planctomycetota bacterium]|nr:EF-hand domain-containing protein [Planctomycetota bacterium]
EPQSFLVHGDNDVTVLGYSIALEVDPTAIELQAISASGTAAEEADFFEASLDSTAGLGGVGCVFDLGGDFSEKKLDPGTNQVLANVSVVILATETMTTEVVLRDISVHPERPPIRNVMTNENGVSIRPGGVGDLGLTLENGMVTISSLAPLIETVEPESAMAGDTLIVTGQRFGDPGLVVRVCGIETTHTVSEGGTRIDVDVPVCAAAGPSSLEVCNEHGCDTETEAFEFVGEPSSDLFVRADADGSGSIDLTDAIRILGYLFLGGEPSRCLDAMDSDDSGSLDLTDGIYPLNYLFVGGPAPPPPFPEAGVDPTADTIPPCAE